MMFTGLFVSSFLRHLLVPKLLEASVTYLKPDQLELPFGLLARLILSNAEFVEQFSNAVQDCNVST